MPIKWDDQAEYLKYANDPITDGLPIISKQESGDEKYDKCFLVYPSQPLPGKTNLPTTGFLRCGLTPEIRVKMI